ncbi:uncharacterized protein NEMAJ01_2023 [Nematocida major]|uniref:uncharacterized protein n=1 Tax=Nematocida major TaxID=1912982 RepID=UPI0020082A16|nr:uncharacterized protein NEMAJ01_2023 [Nematocida major]KAH9387127.1 hypothetical protein NEMAJ01_2023 [Nematocida major]
MEEIMSVMQCALSLLKNMGLAQCMAGPESVVGRLFVPASQLLEARAYLDPFLSAQAEMESLRRLDEIVELQKELNTDIYEACSNESDFSNDGSGSDEHAAPGDFVELGPRRKRFKKSLLTESSVSCAKYNYPYKTLCMLFLALAYDPEKKAYDLQGLRNRIGDTEGAERTKAFIQKLQAQLEACSFFGAFKAEDWRCLGLGDTVPAQFGRLTGYVSARILDSVQALAKITGQPEGVVEGLKPAPKDWREMSQRVLHGNEVEHIYALLRPLAVCKMAGVHVWSYLYNSDYNRAVLTLTHPAIDSARRQILKVTFCSQYTKASIHLPSSRLSARMLKDMEQLAAHYREQAFFPSFVFAECLDTMVLRCNSRHAPDAALKRLQKAARKAIERSPNAPNRVLLALPIVGQEFRKQAVSVLLMCAFAEGVVLTAAHPIVRLAANVIGSADYESLCYGDEIFCVAMYANMPSPLRPSVHHLPEKQLKDFIDDLPTPEYYGLYSHERARVLTRKIIMEYLRAYAVQAKQPLFECKHLKGHDALKKIAYYLLAESPAEALLEIGALLCAGHKGAELEKAKRLSETISFTSLLLLLADEGLAKSRNDILQVYSLTNLACIQDNIDSLCYWDSGTQQKAAELMEDSCIKSALQKAGGPVKFAALQRILQELRTALQRNRAL